MRKKTPRTPAAKKNPAKKKPPTKEKIATLKSKQLNLFQEFVRQEERDSSNAIEQWEAIPKYFFTPDQVEKLRTQDGLAPSFVLELHPPRQTPSRDDTACFTRTTRRQL